MLFLRRARHFPCRTGRWNSDPDARRRLLLPSLLGEPIGRYRAGVCQADFVDAREVEQSIVESLGRNAIGWSVAASTDEIGCWEVLLSHPASNGLGFHTGKTDAAEAVATVLAGLVSTDELGIVAASPTLTHSDAVIGIRSLAQAFRWPNREVGAVAFLMFECGSLSEAEAAWISGFIGDGAPGRPRSPVGPL